MKLRISGNSLRLRLSPTDLDTIRRDGRMECWTGFGPGHRFVYALETSPEVDGLVADFEQDALTITMPQAWIDEWDEDERVGFEAMQPIDGDQHLHVQVEKDLACAHARNGEKERFANRAAMVAAS